MLTSLFVRRHSGCQSDTTRTPSSSRDRKRCRVQHEPQHLTLRRTRISHHENVDVSPQVRTVRQILLDSSQEQEQNGLFDVVGAVDRGGEGLPQERVGIFAFRDATDLANVVVREGLLSDSGSRLGRELYDVVRDNEGPVAGGDE